MKRAFGVLLCILCCTSVLWAQDALVRLIERSPYPEDGKAYLLREVPQIFAEAQGIPEKLLLKKLREGLTKKVSPEHLVEALRRRRDALREALRLLDEAGIEGRDALLEDLAVSLELSVPPHVLREVLAKVASRPKVAERFVGTVATFLEVGVPPETASAILAQVLERNFEAREMQKVAQLLEQARREGMDVAQVAACLREALERHDNFALVEVELQNFIAANKPRPVLRSGQGVVVPSPGVSLGGTPVEEGGAPLEPQPSTGHPPTQEGGAPLE
ncbi:hypothetical protein [Candidatus Caldatribacterium sp.]|uniref:hypothetical protein n=1 Tax=Candidatus Caldatribacterium sp. TaxID=2282143 RepID=UPI0029917A88|nr:hypothetical protein [Candidatus Caldatribacterium sp.]MDW8081784.1 hypothetical protein [Candidatus Calescibacterium sp.]